MNIIIRAAAVAAGAKYYFTGRPCKHGHICERSVKYRQCVDCKRLENKSERMRAYLPQWRAINKEHCVGWNKQYYNQNRECIIGRVRQYYRDNTEYIIQYNYNRYIEKRSQILNIARCKNINNPGIYSAKCARRRARKLQATPEWANSEWEQFVIGEIYHLSTLVTKLTGVPHHVDHIVPLVSEVVSGFHCVANLQIITASENISKGNRVWPDM